MMIEDDTEIILCIDGTGRIPPEAVVDAVQLLQDSNCDAVFAQRGENKGIEPERWIIERFEIFLVEEKYNIKIPDGQCGCWAFVTHKDSERKMNLNASGYELELDILTEVLHKKLKYSFFPVEIHSEAAKSLFDQEQHASKLKYLAEKLGYKRWQLLKFAEYFNENCGRLPEKYMQVLNDIKIEEPKL